MEEENIHEVNRPVKDELKKLIESMSGLNIEHEQTLSVCYAEYFDQKIKEFERVDKQMGLLLRSFTSKANGVQEIQIAANVHKEREEFLFSIRECFACIKEDGFGIPRPHRPIREQANDQTAATSGDNFCDFILKDIGNNCDNGITTIGYGMITSEHCSNNNLNSPKKIKLEIEEYPYQAENVNAYEKFPFYLNSNIPPRLRFKRRFSQLLTKPIALPADDSYPNEVEVKRRRDMQVMNNL